MGTHNRDEDENKGKILNRDGRQGTYPYPHKYLLSSLIPTSQQ